MRDSITTAGEAHNLKTQEPLNYQVSSLHFKMLLCANLACRQPLGLQLYKRGFIGTEVRKVPLKVLR